MPISYINEFEYMISYILFEAYMIVLQVLVLILILSLILLIIGCLIKSQKLKSKFLIVVPYVTIGIAIFLMLPIICVYIKSLF